MQEQLLHRIWQRKRFDHTKLCTTSGKKLKIIHYGNYNTHAGPDFQNGHIQIDGQNWFGHIELHINSSDWKHHEHDVDAAYNNVILHVVYKDDKVVYTESGRILPTLILEDRIDQQVLEVYEKLKGSLDHIPCHPHLQKIDRDKLGLFMHSLL
ncbi:MAG: DUF2851 family protein, partial [Saprospiraceae bacterium]|nr:DUF2851 family protein [Saprospiraceae bacterium]